MTKGVEVIVIENEKMKFIAKGLEEAIENELLSYKEPNKDDSHISIEKVAFKDQEYDLMQRFNDHHEKISRLIGAYNQTVHAIENGGQYHIYFKNGFTYRDDSILRFVSFNKKGSARTDEVVSNYDGVLTASEVLETIEELKEAKCLEFRNDIISVTELGRRVL
ncbi:MAG: hypothetical protein ACFB10_08220 [Salibacteraceae bacterium]